MDKMLKQAVSSQHRELAREKARVRAMFPRRTPPDSNAKLLREAQRDQARSLAKQRVARARLLAFERKVRRDASARAPRRPRSARWRGR